MKKTLKWIAILLGSLFGLLVVAALALTLFVDPNQYKGEIIKTVKAKTGRDLRIDGKIGWSFFPRLGVEAGGVTLSNAPGFGPEPMAKIGTAGASVRLLPLLSGRLAVDTVHVREVTLNLARNKTGKTNWQDLAGSDQPARPAAAAPAAAKQPLAGLTIGRLDLKKINLLWHDQGTGERVSVRDLSLVTGRFETGRPFSLDLALTLARDKAAPIPVKLSAQVVAEADALKLSGFDLLFDESRVTGTVDIRHFADRNEARAARQGRRDRSFPHPVMRAELNVDRFDLDRYRSPGKDTPAAAAGSSAGGDVALPLGLLRSLNLKAGLRVGHLKAFGLRVSDLDTRVSALGGLIQFGPNKAALYGGRYQGQTSLDARGALPVLRMDEKLARVQLGRLLKDMGLFGKFTGEAGVTVNLAAQGGSVNALKRTLTGTITVDSHDGRIEGVNLAKIIQDARKLGAKLAGKPVEVAPATDDNTAFKSMHATLRVKNGVAQNDDFKLDGAQVRAAGKGSIDLVQEKLDFRLHVTVAEGEDRQGTTLPLAVTGGFAKLKFGVDLGAQAKQQVKQKAEDKLRNILRKKH